MILRKPYAFFIKYFRLFHLAIAILSIYLVYKTFSMVSFFSDYAKTLELVMDFEIGKYINVYVFLLVFLVIVFNIILLSVMTVKKKPFVQYIYNLVTYLSVMIMFGFAYSSMRVVSTEILEIASVTLIRDFLIIVGLLQIGTFVMALIRSTGFDIKKFDFGEDLEKLDINVEDNEEFEVAVEFDQNLVKRDIKTRIRYAKYAIVENKFFVTVVSVIVGLFLILLIYFNIGIYSMNVGENETFSASGVTLTVKDSYITTTDYNLNNVSGDDALVVVKIDVRANNSTIKKLNTGLATINVNGHSYAVTSKYINVLKDLGETYIEQEISTTNDTYILVYEIPKALADEKIKFKFNDNVSYVKGEVGAKNIFVKLKPVNLDETEESKINKLGETLRLNDSVLGDAMVKITSYHVAPQFKLNYKYCYETDKCINSIEYVNPVASSNYGKAILKLEGEFVKDENSGLDNMNNLYDFVSLFGTINYTLNDKNYTNEVELNRIIPRNVNEKNVYYVEVVSDLISATKIEFNFKVRNQEYKYTLR